MQLRLGSSLVDLTERALVIGVADLDPARPDSVLVAASALVADGADVVSVRAPADGAATVTSHLVEAVAALSERIDVPIGVEASAPAALAAADAGASLVQFSGGISDGLVVATIDRGAAAVIPTESCASLTSANASDRTRRHGTGTIVVEAPSLDAIQPLLGCGHPVQFSVLHQPTTEHEWEAGLASTAVAIAAGCRLICTRDVVGARRTAAVLAAVVGAR